MRQRLYDERSEARAGAARCGRFDSKAVIWMQPKMIKERIIVVLSLLFNNFLVFMSIYFFSGMIYMFCSTKV